MKIKLSKSQWEQIGKNAGWMAKEPKVCSCGSGLIRRALYDARNIFVDYVCNKCEISKREKYRPEIFTDPNYDHDEPIEEQ